MNHEWFCFVCTSYLLEFIRLENNNKIKPQGIVSKIIIPLTNRYVQASDEIVNLLPDIQEDNLVNSNMYETSEGNISPSDIVVDEQDYVVLARDKVLEDMRVIDSNDKLQLEQ